LKSPINKHNHKEEIYQIADDNNISYEQTSLSLLGAKFTELSDDDNLLDDTTQLAIKLYHLEIISKNKMYELIENHENKKKN